MERFPYKTDFERIKKILFDRYMRLQPNFTSYSNDDRYQWVEASAKNRYCADVKVNNWIEEQWDADYLKQKRPLGSDYDYAYKTEHLTRHGDRMGEKVIRRQDQPRCFPGHQPELDLPDLKKIYNSFETTSRVSYQDPALITSRKKGTTCIYCRLHAGHIRQ